MRKKLDLVDFEYIDFIDQGIVLYRRYRQSFILQIHINEKSVYIISFYL